MWKETHKHVEKPNKLVEKAPQRAKRHLRTTREGAASQTRGQASEHNNYVRVKRYF